MQVYKAINNFISNYTLTIEINIKYVIKSNKTLIRDSPHSLYGR